MTSVCLIFTVALGAQTTQHMLPNDLGRHDFLYAGEAKDRQIFVVRGGKVVWSYSDPGGKGEISDAVLLSNGNILFAHQFAVELISPEKKILWRYDVPVGHEVHTAVPIGADRVLYIQNGDPALLRVVNIKTNATEKQLTLRTANPGSVHGQFRHARLTPQGTLLVSHMDRSLVVEYDASGKELWAFPGSGLWGAQPLDNGDVLVTDKVGVREVDRRGDTIWSWTPKDAPGYSFANLQLAWRLPNGDTVINNWVNEWNAKPGAAGAQADIQAIEVTPEKKVVWALHEWGKPLDLGPATTIQFLDDPSASKPEDRHFGEIR